MIGSVVKVTSLGLSNSEGLQTSNLPFVAVQRRQTVRSCVGIEQYLKSSVYSCGNVDWLENKVTCMEVRLGNAGTFGCVTQFIGSKSFQLPRFPS